MTDSDVVWGVNGHPLTQAPYLSMTYAEQMQEMQSMGLTSYRVDIYDDNPSTMSALSSLITTAQQYDITILPILILNPASYANATDAYNAGYALAEAYAKEFPGMTWELGNEFDDYAILPGTTGESASDYDSAKMAVVAGLLEGMLNGIHQADPTSKGIVDEQGPHFGFFDALAADGVQWDISGLHWYSGDGDLTDVGGVNVLAELASFGHPIEITELNETNGHLSSVQMEASYLSTTMSQIDGLSSTYDITAAYIYELLDQPALSGGEATYGLANATGTINAAGEAVESFLASNPSANPLEGSTSTSGSGGASSSSGTGSNSGSGTGSGASSGSGSGSSSGSSSGSGSGSTGGSGGTSTEPPTWHFGHHETGTHTALASPAESVSTVETQSFSLEQVLPVSHHSDFFLHH
jgi:hypothetical protein